MFLPVKKSRARSANDRAAQTRPDGNHTAYEKNLSGNAQKNTLQINENVICSKCIREISLLAAPAGLPGPKDCAAVDGYTVFPRHDAIYQPPDRRFFPPLFGRIPGQRLRRRSNTAVFSRANLAFGFRLDKNPHFLLNVCRYTVIICSMGAFRETFLYNRFRSSLSKGGRAR